MGKRTDVARGITVGIPSFMTKPLGALVDQAKAQKAVDDNEVCGLFLFMADDWTPGQGWSGEIVYKALANKAAVEDGNAVFEIDTAEATVAMSEAVEARESAVAKVVARHGWTNDTPWDTAVRAVAETEVAALRADDIAVSPKAAREHVQRAVYEECMDLVQAFSSYSVAKGFVSITPDPLEEHSLLKFGREVPRLSAEQWLMARGVSVLLGIGHSHPSGSTRLSPEDMLATKTVEKWKEVFQVRFATDGQKPKSLLEEPKSVGNWIVALSQDADTSVVRYDKAGIRGVWTGPF